MGNEIVYCCRCQNRLRAGDFDDGKALWRSDKPYCVDCIVGLLSSLPAEEEKQILEELALKRANRGGAPVPEPSRNPPARKTSTSRIPVVKTERRTANQSGSGPSPAVIALIAVATVVLLGALSAGVLTSPRSVPEKRSDPSPQRTVELPVPMPPPIKPPAPVEPASELPAVRREEAARKALEKARQYGKANPADLPGRITLLEEAAWESRGTSLAEESRKEHEILQRQRGELLASELAPAAATAADAAAQGRYGEAIALLQKQRSRLSGADWGSAVDQKILQVRQKADQAFTGRKEEALRARRGGSEEEVRKIVGQVSSWGLEEFTSDLRSSLAAEPAPPPDQTPEAREYSRSWDRAFALARARDYAAALQLLEAATKVLGNPALRAEATADLGLLRLLAGAHADVLQALARWPKGQKLSIEVDGPSRVEGTATRTTPSEIELRTEAGPVVVRFDDLTADSLRELLGKIPGRKPEPDARAGALLLLLEGDSTAAASLPAEALPARIRAYGARIAHELSRPDLAALESDARTRFEAAERDYHDPAAKLEAFDRYRALLASHGETAFVRRKRAILAQRLETEKDAGKEYFFLAEQMRSSGAFRRASHAKAAVCWTSSADVPQDKENYVEFTFSAKPATEYRGWIYAGACCLETFAFDLQATELASAEPGAAQGIPVKNTILFLKKTHALHGGRKEPTRFEWIPIPLPKYSSGGAKTVRLLSGQQGFSAGYAFVSAVRTTPPAEPMVKEWERARPASATPDSGLVACWTLDEGAGTAVADTSPHRLSGTLRNDPVWTSGKRRGALSFDGRDDHVEIPKDPRLLISGAFTVAAWVYIAELPKSEFGMYAVSDYTEGGDRCTFSLRILPSGAAQFFWQNEQAHTTHATSATRLAPGAWVHLAGVWDGTVRTLYINGIADGTNGAPQPRPDLRGNLSIGRPGSYNGLYFRGRIDEVRLYGRALSPAEIQKLAR